MAIMKTIKFPGDIEPREIYDEKARELIGDLSNLDTDAKDSLVAAINEVVNSDSQVVITVDTTLTKEGEAADAKAVGDALSLKQPIGDYLTSVPAGYATEEFVTNKIAEAELSSSDVDLSGYAQKSELPTKTSDLTNDSGFLTEVPVESVNGKTGKVVLSAVDVGALPNTTEIPIVPTNVSAFNNDAGYLTEHQSLTGLATESYVNTQIAAIPTPDVSGQINTHNTATDSHNDIRLLIDGLTTRLNTLANSDDTTLDQMSEVVAYIKNNKSLIEGITNNKVNVSDIINNLTTNVSNKPLSAAQGVALKALIDSIVVPTKVSELTNDKGYLTEHQSLDAYAKTADLGSLASKNTVSKSDLASDVQTSLNKANTALQSYTETDPTVPAWAKASTKPTYTASEVGADASGTASSTVAAHNEATDAHADIRTKIEEINSKIVSEVVTMTQEQYESMTQAQFVTLYKQGVRIIAIETVESNSDATYTNLVPLAIDENGNIFGEDYDSDGVKDGWICGKRVNSTGGLTDVDNSFATGFIEIQSNDVIRIKDKGNRLIWNESGQTTNNNAIAYYDEDFSFIGSIALPLAYYGICKDYINMCEPTGTTENGGIVIIPVPPHSSIQYCRISCCCTSNAGLDGADLIVTRNKEII